MRRTPRFPVALLILSCLILVPRCKTYGYGSKFPAACHQVGLVYEIGVFPNNHVTIDPACVDRKQTILWKRLDSDRGFRIHFEDAATPIKPTDQECRRECRAQIAPDAPIGSKWAYKVTDLTTGRSYDPVIIIDGCCVTNGP
jgi:hypothetical protein